MKNNQITKAATEQIVSAIKTRLKGRTNPLVVSLDGGSGAGKSTLAAEVASHLGATVIQCDDFFAATITDDEWDTYTSELKCRRCIDWQRMRTEALLPLIAGENAQYHPFSFSSENGLSLSFVTKEPSMVIILDGIYSSLPELSDVVDFKVLVDVLPDVRRYRHNVREGNDDMDWHLRWDSAEDYYFSVLCPPTSFDLIVVNE
ncbi:uridine kinase family protein [Lederbergia citri]|uniref:(D)CMP kinase n=1 Tax=Lederbergia citri TaxID=2833580 RepID=A0A942YG47_9BACI|nr:(d)CMP kinase [Lederbergia citri]MBS4195167.1 (d)CMP kinase [Lederbergia citri]